MLMLSSIWGNSFFGTGWAKKSGSRMGCGSNSGPPKYQMCFRRLARRVRIARGCDK